MTGERKTILDVRDLQIVLPAGGDRPYALSDFNLTVGEGEIVCLVGESGSGKSLAANAVMRLLPEPHVRVSQGTIRLDGEDLLSLPEAGMRAIRGDRMAMIFQEPMTALNPVVPVGRQNDLKIADIENGLPLAGHFFCLGLSASLRPSPIRLNDSTVRRIATPGMTEQNQAVRKTARP
jgi:ABC-type microcin C transport system duplicated ATPase subunit YejF